MTARAQALGALFSCLIGQASFGQTFYVSEDGVDQAGGGSVSSPWASIGFATNNVPDGAIIEVLPGTYLGRSRLKIC